MQFVRQPKVRWRVLAVRYPAPLCERCNVPLAFNGEHAYEDKPSRCEYQCPICNGGKIGRRTRRSE